MLDGITSVDLEGHMLKIENVSIRLFNKLSNNLKKKINGHSRDIIKFMSFMKSLMKKN